MSLGDQKGRGFTRREIQALNIGLIGIYGLYRGDTWIYVGRGDIRERLLAHLNGDHACISRQVPTHWVATLTMDHEAMEKKYIRLYDPICNIKIG